MERRRVARGGVGWVILLGLLGMSACGDVLAPTHRFDPDLTLHRLDEVLTPLDADGDFLLGLDLAVATLDFYGGSILGEAIALRPGQREGLLGTVRSATRGAKPGSGVADGARALERSPGAFTIPFTLAGETLEWDRRDGYVISGRAGAPFNGVRFVLYRMDRQTRYPAVPLARIGYLDLTDEDGIEGEVVHVRAVQTVGRDRVIADYRVSLIGSGTFDEGWLEILTRGAVGDATPVGLDLTQLFEWSRRADRETLGLDYRYRRGTRSIVLEGVAASRYDVLEWETFDFGVSFRGGSPATEIEANVARDGSLRGDIFSDGRRVVRIGGHDGRPTFRRTDGQGMTFSETATLERIWTGITELIRVTEWVNVPADLLTASG